MTRNTRVALLIALPCTVVMWLLIYAITAFVLWDSHWLSDIAEWWVSSRLFFLLFGVGLPAFLGLMIGAAAVQLALEGKT